MPTGTSGNVLLGAGTLYVAAIGTAEPASASAALPSAWRDLGYTEDGVTFAYELTVEDILVNEEYDPVQVATTGRKGTVAVKLAETTLANLALAYNQGAAYAGTSLEPPDVGSESRVMLVYDTSRNTPNDGARYLFRRCLAAESIEMSRKKAPDKSLIPITWHLEKPSGSRLFKVFPSASSLA